MCVINSISVYRARGKEEEASGLLALGLELAAELRRLEDALRELQLLFQASLQKVSSLFFQGGGIGPTCYRSSAFIVFLLVEEGIFPMKEAFFR